MNISIKSLVKGISALCIVSMSAIDMAAVPATPYPITKTLPDGTELTVRLHGDEHGSFVTTTDGYLLMQDASGFYNYAKKDVSGNIVSTDCRAVDVEMRGAADNAMLRSIDREAVVGARISELNRARDVQRISRIEGPATGIIPPVDDIDHHREACHPTTPSLGKPRLLVVLIEFADKEFTIQDPYDTFYRMLNEEGYSDYNCTGSVRDYFVASSNGKYAPDLDLYGPVKLPQTSAYYAGNGGAENTQILIRDACNLIDDQVDFSIYDTDNDGVVDNVYLFYAGFSQADTGDKSCVWPHSTQVGGRVVHDGVALGNYTCSNELRGFSNYIAGIGTFCHEFSHALGLPDLYEVQYTHQHTPGLWSIMDQGSYSNDSRTPPLHSAYERWTLGWLTPEVIVAEKPGNSLLRPATSEEGYNDVKLVRTSTADEFFLLENRQLLGWDSYLPGHGMLMWHIDFNATAWATNRVNQYSTHPRVDIVEASGDITHTSTSAASFPGTMNVMGHTIEDWNGRKLGVEIDGIYESEGGNVYFNINGGNQVEANASVLNEPVVEANTVTLSWSPVKDAEYYIVYIYDADGNPVQSERVYTNSYTTTLAESTGYTCRLVWMIGSDCFYCETAVTTGYLPISVHTVNALEPEAVAADGVTAVWEHLPIAKSYTVEIAICEGVEGRTFTEDFTGRQVNNDGWVSTATWNTQRYGASAPAITLKEGTSLTVPAWERPIDSVRFFVSSSSSLTTASLIVETIDSDGNATEVYRERAAAYKSTDKEALMVTLGKDVLGMDAYGLKFTMTGTVNWVVLDDISVIYDETYSYHDAGIAPKEAGSATSLEVTGLAPGTVYAYRVIADDGSGLKSRPSQWIVFTTTGSSGIGDIVVDDEGVDSPWYTLTGLRLDVRPSAPGLYIHNRRLVRVP